MIAGCNAMIQLDDPSVNIALPGLREALGLPAVGAVSTAEGLLLAGTLTSFSSWHWVLYLDVPLGLTILLPWRRGCSPTATGCSRTWGRLRCPAY
ncbi:hypothetical protein DIZ27_43655 [Streptomyces sp. NWU339]|nr:hypothetical protein DIZ27_43655 [Streptomyces sp. NWU339]